ncbi:MAG: hypothetical protein A2328_11095 [Bdellovibrionales bacterium RIFOXYB2_FULL_36_6]|nr:MAG: hypothetical protein A2328_11095 [Bdellovibrionales bacterium RIFOXYB2_FULL_36_6]
MHPHPENKIPLNLALNYLALQPRSIHEIHLYLTKKGFDEDIVSSIIDLLMEYKYLDDRNFTKSFVESRVKNKPKSKFALTYELNKKGIDSNVIEDVLKDYDDYGLALKALEPKIRLWVPLNSEIFKKKIMNFLQYRGFSYSISVEVNNHFNSIRAGKPRK